jgi:hypothetical protein
MVQALRQSRRSFGRGPHSFSVVLRDCACAKSTIHLQIQCAPRTQLPFQGSGLKLVAFAVVFRSRTPHLTLRRWASAIGSRVGGVIAELPMGKLRPYPRALTPRVQMTVHTPKLLTPEEFASLLEVAVTSPNARIPAPHLAKLVALGFVAETAKGLVVTGDGLIRITESE